MDKEAQKIADFAVNDPIFNQLEKYGCHQRTTANVLDHWVQVVAGTNYKFTVEIETNTGPRCTRKQRKICKDVTVHRPLPGKCYQRLGQKPKKVRRGSGWFLVGTNACDSLTHIDKLMCSQSGKKKNQVK